ncbi:MFS transporter [Streptomyces axinellae]|uniref:MFS transporter n=1 Tax=Streptomyces axinellae TaxID=552788 RepID=A0ABN3PZ55_9ACTN
MAGRRRLGREFRWLWAAYAVSSYGTGFGLGAFPLIAVLVLHSGPAQVAALAAAGRIVGAVLAVPLGPWVEFRRKRPVMIAMDLTRFAVLLSIPVAFAFGRLSFAQLLVVSVVTAGADITFKAASGAYLKALLPSADLLVANSRFESTMWTSTTLGPPLGGAAMGVFGPVTTVVADALSFLLSALGLRAIGGTEPRPERQARPARPVESSDEGPAQGSPARGDTEEGDTEEGPVRDGRVQGSAYSRARGSAGGHARVSAAEPQRESAPERNPAPERDSARGSVRSAAPRPRAGELLEGWRHILAHPTLRPLFFNALAVNALIMVSEPLLVVLLVDHLGFAPWQYGLAFAAPCVGGLIGSRLARRLVARFGQRRMLCTAGTLRVIWPVGLAFVQPGVPGLVLIIALQLGLVTCISLYNPVLATYRLDHTAPDRVARVLSAWSVSGSATIAALTAVWGLLAAATSPRTAIAAAGVLLLATPLLLPRGAKAPQDGSQVPPQSKPEDKRTGAGAQETVDRARG